MTGEMHEVMGRLSDHRVMQREAIISVRALAGTPKVMQVQLAAAEG